MARVQKSDKVFRQCQERGVLTGTARSSPDDPASRQFDGEQLALLVMRVTVESVDVNDSKLFETKQGEA